MQRPGQKALAREIAKDIIAEAGFGRPLCSAPATEIRLVTGDFDTGLGGRSHCQHFAIPQRSARSWRRHKLRSVCQRTPHLFWKGSD